MVLGSIDTDIRLNKDRNFSMNIEVLVVDVSSGPIISRKDLTDALRAFPKFSFEKLANKTYENCTAEQMRTDSGGPGQPPCSVRQQTRDVASALRQCAGRVAPDGWVALVEDDTEMCAGALQVMTGTLLAVGRRGGWRFVAFSNYFSGTAFAQPAAAAFAEYASGRLGERPIDHLVWDAWGPGAYIESQGNLFAHRGRVSVFEYRNTADFREQYDTMRFSGRQSDCIQLDSGSILASAGIS